MTHGIDTMAAARPGDFLNLIIFVLVALMVAGAKLLEKWLARHAEQQAAERRHRGAAAGRSEEDQAAGQPSRLPDQAAPKKRHRPMPPQVYGKGTLRRGAQVPGAGQPPRRVASPVVLQHQFP